MVVLENRGSNHPAFQQGHDGFDLVVLGVVVRVVFRLEVVAPKSGEALVEEGAHFAAQFLNHLIGGVACFAVDEADEDEALGDGQVFQFFGVLVSDFLFGLLHQAVALRLFGNIRQNRVVFLHLGTGQFGVGIHLPYVAGQTAALARVESENPTLVGSGIIVLMDAGAGYALLKRKEDKQ